MSCATIRIGLPPISSISSGAMTMGKINIDPINENPNVSALGLGNMVVDVALVCMTSNGVYLRVRPEDVMWITVGKGIEYQVITNTDWRIE